MNAKDIEAVGGGEEVMEGGIMQEQGLDEGSELMMNTEPLAGGGKLQQRRNKRKSSMRKSMRQSRKQRQTKKRQQSKQRQQKKQRQQSKRGGNGTKLSDPLTTAMAPLGLFALQQSMARSLKKSQKGKRRGKSQKK